MVESTLTPLETATVKAMAVAQGLAASALVIDLLVRQEKAWAIIHASYAVVDHLEKIEAQNEIRTIIQTFNLIAIHQESMGIGA